MRFFLPIIALGNSGLGITQTPGKLNDTGIVTCANDTSNNIPCGFSDGDSAGFPRQDGQSGRAAKDAAGVSLGKIGTSDPGSRGFDFSKVLIDGTVQNGTSQPAVFGTGPTNWACTKDNVTGLIWHLKSGSGNDYRLATNTYKWYSADPASNGGNSGNNSADTSTCYNSNCDTAALITYVNSLNICGETANDWRLPTRLELTSIVDTTPRTPLAYVKTGGSGNNGATTISVSNVTSLGVGFLVAGAGIGLGVTVVSISGTTLTLSLPNNENVSGSITFTQVPAGVDATYFPYVMAGTYWTSDNVAANPLEARTLNMTIGTDGTEPKGAKNYVILVRP